MIEKDMCFCFNHECPQNNEIFPVSELLFEVEFIASQAKLVGSEDPLSSSDNLDAGFPSSGAENTENNNMFYFSLEALVASGGDYVDQNGDRFTLEKRNVKEVADIDFPFNIFITHKGKVSVSTKVGLDNRVCPYCHAKIAESFGFKFIHPIMMFGATSSGKTVILAGTAVEANRTNTVNGITLNVKEGENNELDFLGNLLEKIGHPTESFDSWTSRVLFVHFGHPYSDHVFMMCDAAGEYFERGRTLGAQRNTARFYSLVKLADAIVIVRDGCSLEDIVAYKESLPSHIGDSADKSLNEALDRNADRYISFLRDRKRLQDSLKINRSESSAEPSAFALPEFGYNERHSSPSTSAASAGDTEEDIYKGTKAIRIKLSEVMGSLGTLLGNCHGDIPRILYVVNKIDILQALFSIRLENTNSNLPGARVFENVIKTGGYPLIDVESSMIFKTVNHSYGFNMGDYCKKALELSEFLSKADQNYRVLPNSIISANNSPARGLTAVSGLSGDGSVLEVIAWLMEAILKDDGKFCRPIEEQFCQYAAEQTVRRGRG